MAHLQKFLIRIRDSRSVSELVIGGDLFDEWYVPANVDTYQGKDFAGYQSGS